MSVNGSENIVVPLESIPRILREYDNVLELARDIIEVRLPCYNLGMERAPDCALDMSSLTGRDRSDGAASTSHAAPGYAVSSLECLIR